MSLLLAVYTIYILYSTHRAYTRVWHQQPDASSALRHIGWHTDFGWPLWLRVLAAFYFVYFHFGFHFLVASFSFLFSACGGRRKSFIIAMAKAL